MLVLFFQKSFNCLHLFRVTNRLNKVHDEITPLSSFNFVTVAEWFSWYIPPIIFDKKKKGHQSYRDSLATLYNQCPHALGLGYIWFYFHYIKPFGDVKAYQYTRVSQKRSLLEHPLLTEIRIFSPGPVRQ
jgi:hypothetical protein